MNEDDVDYTVHQLIDELKKYPEDLPVWFMFQHSNGIISLFDLMNIGCVSLGGDDYIHFIFKNSDIYNENKKSIKYMGEFQRLEIENKELKNQIGNLTKFFTSKGYDLNDFNDFIVKEWKKE